MAVERIRLIALLYLHWCRSVCCCFVCWIKWLLEYPFMRWRRWRRLAFNAGYRASLRWTQQRGKINCKYILLQWTALDEQRTRERERNMNKYTSMSRKKIAETKSFGECEALGIKNFRKNVLPKLQNYIVPFLVNNFAEIFCNEIIGNIVDILFIRCGRMWEVCMRTYGSYNDWPIFI